MIKFRYDRLFNKLKKLEKDVAKTVTKKTIIMTLLKIQATAMENTPNKTGNLKGSYETAFLGGSGVSHYGKIWNKAVYAMAIHEKTWQTLHHGGRHKFLEYAMELERAYFKRILAFNVNKAVRNISSE